jgi:serine/threonine protein kinase
MSDYPDELSAYKIIEPKIGFGGFSVVHKAECDKGVVALKVPRDIDKAETLDMSIFQSLFTEAQLWYKLSQKDVPGVVKLFAYGNKPYPWMAMQFMPGGTLRERMDKLELEDSLDIAVTILNTLNYSHHLGVIHRDIKPGNILFDTYDEPRLTDWGLGKVLLSIDAADTGPYKGTVVYSALEQFDPKISVDWRTDIFQMGAVLYHMLTGVPPLPADPLEALNNLKCDGIQDPKELNPAIPDHICQAILKALELEKDDRFENASMFLRAIKGEVVIEGAKETKVEEELPPQDETSPKPYVQLIESLEKCQECRNYITTDNKKLKCKRCDKIFCEACERWIDKLNRYRGIKLVMRHPLCEACYKIELKEKQQEIDTALKMVKRRFMDILDHLAGSFRAYLLDDRLSVVDDIPINKLEDILSKTKKTNIVSIVLDGPIDQKLLTLAGLRDVKNLVGVKVEELEGVPEDMHIYGKEDL